MVAYNITIDSSRTLRPAVVSTRVLWSGEWFEWTPNFLFCASLSRAVAPGMSQATLVLDYGWMKLPNLNFSANLDFDSLLGQYVRIVLTSDADDPEEQSTVTWYGIVVEMRDEQHGTKSQEPGGDGIEQGRQTFTCYGLEWLWTRQQIAKSIVAVDAAVTDSEEIARALVFNGGKGDRLEAGDQHRHNKAIGQPVFASEVKLDTTEPWTAKDILTYIVEWFSPAAFGAATFDFSACGELDWYQPTLDVEGRSPWEVLTMLCDRRRGLGWYLEIEDDQPVLHFFSFADADITLPSGKAITANPQQYTLDYDTAPDVVAVLEETSATRFSQVVARGARRTSTFSLSKTGDSLVDDWTSAHETEYLAAASGEGTYPAARDQRELRNDAWRQRDELKRVYAYFRLNEVSLHAYGDDACFPTLDPGTGNVQATSYETVWYPGLRFLSHLLLKQSTDNTSGLPGTDLNGDVAQAEFLRPFAVIKYDGTKYEFVEKIERMGGDNESAADGNGFDFALSVRVQDSCPGVVFDCHGLQHQVAKNHFNPATAAPSNADQPPQLDYDDIIVTVSAQADSYAEAKYPSEPEAVGENEEILYLDVRDRARLDYLVAGTVVGLRDGALQTAAGGFLRDDREYLADLARAAWEWYRTRRVALALTLRQVSGQFALGDLITQIGSVDHEQEVNTVVTQISWDMLHGTTTIETHFGELDFTALG